MIALKWVLLSVSLSSITSIFALAAIAALRREFQFFPPPDKRSWQHRIFVTLFRLFLYPLVALTVVAFEPLSNGGSMLHYGIGGLLLLVGFGLAVWITLQMGWRNAFGAKRGLITGGWFKFSRNPVYVATWVGLLGWGLIANQWPVTILLLAWALLYVLAPFVEEPWLEAQYGAAYRDYKAKTRRFF